MSHTEAIDTKETKSSEAREILIPLGKHTAAALKADVDEINQLQAALQMRLALNKRQTDAMLMDAGYDPAKYPTYSLAERNGAPCMILKEA